VNMSDNVIPFESQIMLKAALAYASRGWHVLPCFRPKPNEAGKLICGCGKEDCESPGKHPHGFLARRGQMEATTDPEVIKRWFSYGHQLNIAVQCSQSGLAVIDIDPRNGGELTKENVEAKHGKLYSHVEQFTGGGGQHYVYSNPYGVHGLPSKLGPGIDVKANGYIMVWPSLHVSGLLYEWEASSDPTEGAVPSPLPDWLRDLAGPKHEAPEAQGSRYAPPEQIEDLKAALAYLSADDYHDWINTGLALKAIGGVGFELWDIWSQTSDKYNGNLMGPKWRSFKAGTRQIESIFHQAMEAGWVNVTYATVEPVSIEAVQSYQPKEIPVIESSGPLPGILSDVVDWINATSRKPQPDFAIQAAMAFVATVAGRRYKTTQNNFPSLYFLNIGKSASGKEHAKWAIETLLEACQLPQLIGPAGYTSDSGVLSSLHTQPSHIGIIDEFGKVLEGASIKHGARAASTMKALMETWGRCHGTMRPQGYSTFGMSQADADRLASKSIRNPALTLLAMTTPETLYETVGSAAARDGFLNRFLIVETDIGRQAGRPVQDTPVPQSIIEWAARHTQNSGLVNVMTPDLAPDMTIIAFSPAATERFKAFEHECIGLMDEYEEHGLAEMFGRSNEIAMRISLIHAVASDSESITGAMADKSIEYVKGHAVRVAERLKTAVSDNEFEAVCNQVLSSIRALLKHGRTERELCQSSRRFKGLDKRGRLNVLTALEHAGEIAKVEIPPASGRGQPRVAWVAVSAEA
jgi:hypothetical protein